MFTVPDLLYPFDALEPHIDAQTMHIHHDKHHGAYVTNLNTALENFPELKDLSVEELLKAGDSIPESIRTVVNNNAGGHANHTLFWESLTPQSSGAPVGTLKDALDKTFGSFVSFQEEMAKKALSVFGSGWVWLVQHDSQLEIITTPNQNSPLTTGSIPLLGIDVWEHAYYLLYNNRRADYISAVWNIINWDIVNDRYQKITS